MYEVVFAPEALEDREWFKLHTNKSVQKKILDLLRELEQHPYQGTGQPERLSYNLSGYMSRRINRDHRLLYIVNEGKRTVEVLQMRGHY